jgi:hypothetical protein
MCVRCDVIVLSSENNFRHRSSVAARYPLVDPRGDFGRDPRDPVVADRHALWKLTVLFEAINLAATVDDTVLDQLIEREQAAHFHLVIPLLESSKGSS